MPWNMVRAHYPLCNPEVEALERDLEAVAAFCVFMAWLTTLRPCHPTTFCGIMDT